MAYASGHTFYDADSHIMELPDFLIEHADPQFREAMPKIRVEAPRLQATLGEAAMTKAHSSERVAEMIAMGDALITGPKGYLALGAFNRDERSKALDMLGFHKQLVFASFSEMTAFSERLSIEHRYAAARSHNRAMAEFCAKDSRLMGVALLPLDDTQMAIAELGHAQKLGLRAMWIPHRACGGRSPGHNDLDPVWARLAEANIPFVLHVGAVAFQVDPVWMNTGRPVPNDWLGGGENIRGKDMITLHHMVESFIGAMVLDGVFERHPKLRGGAIELGAGWVPSALKRLDWVAEIWRKSEPDLAALKRRPSEQVIEQMAFTPYPYEDVGDLIRQSDQRLYLFSSDYPHVEGGRNPLGRFESTMKECGAGALTDFYSGNFARLFAL